MLTARRSIRTVPRSDGTHSQLRREKLEMGWPAVNDVTALLENCQQLRNLFRRMLQVVVHGDNYAIVSRPNSAQQSIVLAVIAHQVDGVNPWVTLCKFADHVPAAVGAAVVYQHKLVAGGDRRQSDL